MSIAIISDTHFGARSFNKRVFENQMKFFETQFFPYILENNIREVIHLGDLVHNRNTIDLWILQEIKRRFFQIFEKNNIKFHSIVGNHCLYYKNSNDYSFQIENLREFKNAIVYSEPTEVKIGKYHFGMIPWIVDHSNLKLPERCDILAGHFEFKDFPMNSRAQLSMDGMDPKAFDRYKMILSGHYHSRSSRGNIHYIGTQYQISWGDFAEPKGFAVLNDSFDLKYIENIITPRYLKVYITEENDKMKIGVVGFEGSERMEKISVKRLEELNRTNYLKIIISGIINHSKLDYLYQRLSTESMDGFKIEIIDSNEVIETLEFGELEKEIMLDSSVMDIASSYINEMKFDQNIDKEVLSKMLKNLYQRSKDLVI